MFRWVMIFFYSFLFHFVVFALKAFRATALQSANDVDVSDCGRVLGVSHQLGLYIADAKKAKRSRIMRKKHSKKEKERRNTATSSMWVENVKRKKCQQLQLIWKIDTKGAPNALLNPTAEALKLAVERESRVWWRRLCCLWVDIGGACVGAPGRKWSDFVGVGSGGRTAANSSIHLFSFASQVCAIQIDAFPLLSTHLSYRRLVFSFCTLDSALIWSPLFRVAQKLKWPQWQWLAHNCADDSSRWVFNFNNYFAMQ